MFCLIPGSAEEPRAAATAAAGERRRTDASVKKRQQPAIQEEEAEDAEAEPFRPLRRVGKPRDGGHDVTKM